jgi:hypothetical protein
VQGVDDMYDQQIYAFFIPYHMLLDTVQRLAINAQGFTPNLINLGTTMLLTTAVTHSND